MCVRVMCDFVFRFRASRIYTYFGNNKRCRMHRSTVNILCRYVEKSQFIAAHTNETEPKVDFIYLRQLTKKVICLKNVLSYFINCVQS